MCRLRALPLLLTACLAVSANPVPTLPDDIQVQENFDLSRVRLASGVTGVSSWGQVLPASGSHSPHLELRGGSLKAFPAQTVWGLLKRQLTCHSMGLV